MKNDAPVRLGDEPWFWREAGLAASLARALLTPAAIIYDAAQRARALATKPITADIPVICIGNATLGGVGKTPFAIALKQLLEPEVGPIAFLTRGYGGALRGPVRVETRATARDVGDEALLLARTGPTIVSKNRPEGARLAVSNGAQLIIMDDGFQNPTLAKDVTVLLKSETPPANASVFPAGPYREPSPRAEARADVVVTIGRDARLAPTQEALASAAQIGPVLAFCGVGRPHRFAATLKEAGYDVHDFIEFPDHHPFTDQEIRTLKSKAEKTGVQLITTEKDSVRLSPDQRQNIAVLPVSMHITAGPALKTTILGLLDERRPGWRPDA
ncbi:MAG: tetraacyldisaccharide 4'-kinase [Pseudomonadota bacterium]